MGALDLLDPPPEFGIDEGWHEGRHDEAFAVGHGPDQAVGRIARMWTQGMGIGVRQHHRCPAGIDHGVGGLRRRVGQIDDDAEAVELGHQFMPEIGNAARDRLVSG